MINNVLVVAPDFPFPPTYGGAADIWGRILVLVSMGLEVHLICAPKSQPDSESIATVKQQVASLMLVGRKNKITDLLRKHPLQVTSRKALQLYDFDKKFDLILLESEYVGAILENKTLKYTNIALRVHNNESKYFWSLYKSSNGITKLYYASEAWKFSKYQQKIIKEINNYLFISKDECDSFLANNKKEGLLAYHIPPPLPQTKRERNLTTKNVLFVGSLFMPNNIEALNWYLEQVHPKLKNIKDYRLIIAGSTKGKSNSYLNKLSKEDHSIEYYPDAVDLEPIYEQGSVFINPMLNGAGVKLKSIHAIQEGLPVVSTTVGMEGTGLKPGLHYKLADTPHEFAKEIQQLLENLDNRRSMVIHAQEHLRKYYNQAAILEEFFNKIGKRPDFKNNISVF
ncbi:glycosyltransferase family 4 protein [Pontibacter sp. MBLB2868]|uniref:glycosyltransferase family 4 protein n=1 Tax=Pontibacter sp. MBLB2868 TaxID=3451555 RepID=UPI003F753165